MRCTECDRLSRNYYLPSLDMTKCDQCGVFCGECEFVHYGNEYNELLKLYIIN